MQADLSHEYVEKLKQTHPALKLLNADHSPLIISFLFSAFIQKNRRSIPASELISKLEDYLFDLKDTYGEEKYPRKAQQYLEEWSSHEQSYLRKYYPNLTGESQEPEFDLKAATEKAIRWMQSLGEQQFVGTESRMKTILHLLHEIVDHGETDPKLKIQKLKKQKEEIQKEIKQLKKHNSKLPDDPTQIKERFFQAEETAKNLLSDFRQVEQNFRDLDREMRERFALSDQKKGDLLDEVFDSYDHIRQSDQGKSFQAFWEFLMSLPFQEELGELLQQVYQLETVRQLHPDSFLQKIKSYLLDAGEKAYKTCNLLNEQLRKYLNEQVHLENRRILELIHDLEKKVLEVKDLPPLEKDWIKIETPKPALNLSLGFKTLGQSPKKVELDSSSVTQGEVAFDASALYQQVYVDPLELRANIRRMLQSRAQATLKELLEEFPLKKGLAELVTYLNLAHQKDIPSKIENQLHESIVWEKNTDHLRRIEIPKVTFLR